MVLAEITGGPKDHMNITILQRPAFLEFSCLRPWKQCQQGRYTTADILFPISIRTINPYKGCSVLTEVTANEELDLLVAEGFAQSLRLHALRHEALPELLSERPCLLTVWNSILYGLIALLPKVHMSHSQDSLDQAW